MKPNYDQLLTGIRQTVSHSAPGLPALDAAMKFLHTNRGEYHWVGIYFLKGDLLHVGPYYGPETNHTEIRVGQGVCGTAVQEDKNQVINDVRTLDNYLACNLETRSEIVVLIKDDSGKTLGQIDVDGRKVGAFNHGEEDFLNQVAQLLAPHMLN